MTCGYTLSAADIAVMQNWPHTAATLDRIVGSLTRDAEREDQNADQRDW